MLYVFKVKTGLNTWETETEWDYFRIMDFWTWCKEQGYEVTDVFEMEVSQS